MVTFLAPAALFGFSLLAIPIVVHLFKPRKVRRTPFSSLRWLELSRQKLARRIRWHQWLLFALRAAFLSLLVLALARPAFRSDPTTAVAERFVMLDVSRSMSHRSGDRPSPLETGKRTARAILDDQRPGDRAALLTIDRKSRVLAPLSPVGADLSAPLASLEGGLSDTDLGAALDVVRGMLGRCRPEARVELHFITDNFQSGWRRAAIAAFREQAPAGLRVVVHDVASPGPQNAWIDDARLVDDGPSGRRVLEVELRASGGATAHERTLRLAGLPNLRDRSQNVSLESGRTTLVRFELPDDLAVAGRIAELALEPPDGSPSDDRWFAPLDGRSSLQVLLVEGAAAGREGRSAGHALKAALDALSSPARVVTTTVRGAAQVRADDLRDADAVLLADVAELPEGVVAELKTRVREGLGLGLFLGPNVNVAWYNAALVDPLKKAEGLSPLRLDRLVRAPVSQGGLAPLDDVDWRHPLLAGLFDPELGDLAAVQFGAYFRFVGGVAERDVTLATVGGVPAIVEHPLGAGRVVLFNTTADDAWSDLARRKSFVPLVDRLVNHLSGGARRRMFEVGETATVAIEPVKAGETLTVKAPGGRRLATTVEVVGRHTWLRVGPLEEPGAYQIERSGRSEPEPPFVAQVGRGDSQLTPFDADLLRTWWAPTEFVAADVAERVDRPRLAALAAAVPSAVWLIALAAAMLAIDTYLVHRLCPRAAPTLTVSRVRRAATIQE